MNERIAFRAQSENENRSAEHRLGVLENNVRAEAVLGAPAIKNFSKGRGFSKVWAC